VLTYLTPYYNLKKFDGIQIFQKAENNKKCIYKQIMKGDPSVQKLDYSPTRCENLNN